MKELIDNYDLEYIVTSSYEDDGYDYEIWYKKQCLIVISINDNSVIDVTFGNINDLTWSYDVLIKLLNDACDIIKNKHNDFRKSNVDKLK